MTRNMAHRVGTRRRAVVDGIGFVIACVALIGIVLLLGWDGPR